MSAKHPPRYVERFCIEYNRGPVRVSQLMEIAIDLATIRRVMGVHAAYSKLRKCQKGHVSVIAIGSPLKLDDATSGKMEVRCDK